MLYRNIKVKIQMKRKLFIFLLINAFLIIYFFNFLFHKTDMESYVGATRLLYKLPGGVDDGTCQFVKIFPLLLPGFLEKAMNVNAAYGFTIQNIILYFFTVYLIFAIAMLLYNEEKIAFLAAIIYATASPFLTHSLGYQTDMTGWFFGIFGIWLVLKKFNSIQKPAVSFSIGLVMGIGMLNKESAFIAPLFAGIYILLSKLSQKTKSKILIIAVLGFLIPVLTWNFIVYKSYGYTALTWLNINHEVADGKFYNLPLYFQQSFRTLDMHWFLFIGGGIILIRQHFKAKLPLEVRNYLIATAASILLWLVWPYPAERMFYLSAPFLIIVAAQGASYFKKYSYYLVFVAAAFNYFLLYNIYKYNTPNLLYICSALFCAIILMCFLYQSKTYRNKKTEA